MFYFGLKCILSELYIFKSFIVLCLWRHFIPQIVAHKHTHTQKTAKGHFVIYFPPKYKKTKIIKNYKEYYLKKYKCVRVSYNLCLIYTKYMQSTSAFLLHN